MNDNIIPLREYDGPWLSGTAICGTCKNEWIATAPCETKRLECPSCSGITGVFKFEVIPEKEIWNCSCGNDLFYVCRDSFVCRICGKHQIF